METTWNYEHPVDEMLIEPSQVSLQYPVVPLPARHLVAPATLSPSTSNTPNVIIQRKMTQERSLSPERKKKHNEERKDCPLRMFLQVKGKSNILEGQKEGTK